MTQEPRRRTSEVTLGSSHMCSLNLMVNPGSWRVAGLFAGVGGLELGLARTGMHFDGVIGPATAA